MAYPRRFVVLAMDRIISQSSHPKDFTILKRTRHRSKTKNQAMIQKTMLTITSSVPAPAIVRDVRRVSVRREIEIIKKIDSFSVLWGTALYMNIRKFCAQFLVSCNILGSTLIYGPRWTVRHFFMCSDVWGNIGACLILAASSYRFPTILDDRSSAPH